MLVSELLAVLQTVSPDAEVRLYGEHRPGSACPSGTAEGPLVYVAISQVDDSDRLVMLSNCVTNQRGDTVFDAPPQIKRFKVSTSDGHAAAVADLVEQGGCEPTQDLRVELEKEKLRDIFRNFKDLLQ